MAPLEAKPCENKPPKKPSRRYQKQNPEQIDDSRKSTQHDMKFPVSVDLFECDQLGNHRTNPNILLLLAIANQT